jgi:succinate-semialdehyde dehydrogenase/glutarate-semialdehyde dehydrogenase
MHLDEPALLQTRALVGGEWIFADSGATFGVINPSTGEPVEAVADLGVGETRRAIEAAASAQRGWAALTVKDRGAILRRWYDLYLEHAEDLARLMTAEMGKPVAQSRGEVAYAAGFIDWFAEEGKRARGEVLPTHDASKRLMVLRQPVGVVAAITPWNFPHAMVTRKVAPALAAGCAVIVKPARQAALSALASAVLAEQAGVPPGVLNVVTTTDSQAVGEELATNPIVRKLSFTGSTAVGRHLLALAAATITNVSMELGGNAPFIVFDDADLDAAVEGAIASKYRAAGQTCVCANRMLVQQSVHEEFATRLVTAVQALRVGPPDAEGTDIGPLVDGPAAASVADLVDEAVAAGATVLAGGTRHPLGPTFYEPTVLAGATVEMRIAHEEIFGPVAPLFAFETEAEAIAMANTTSYGLAAYLYTRDVGRTWRVTEALEYGIVGVNTGLISTEMAPFGGMKESGIGREGSHDGLAEYLETKYVALGGLEG